MARTGGGAMNKDKLQIELDALLEKYGIKDVMIFGITSENRIFGGIRGKLLNISKVLFTVVQRDEDLQKVMEGLSALSMQHMSQMVEDAIKLSSQSEKSDKIVN